MYVRIPPTITMLVNMMEQLLVMNISYTEELLPEAKEQCIHQITAVDNVDPFVSGRIGEITAEVPPVDTCDSVSYLVLQTSFKPV